MRKGAGRNGRRKNIGTGEVIKTANVRVIKTAKDEMNKKAGINRTKEKI
jgi:hypothetical protein